MAKDAGIVKLNLRLPKGLHRHLVQQANRNNVSLNTEIINILERDRRDRSVPPVNIQDVVDITARGTAARTAAGVIETLERRGLIPPGEPAADAPRQPPKEPESK